MPGFPYILFLSPFSVDDDLISLFRVFVFLLVGDPLPTRIVAGQARLSFFFLFRRRRSRF